MALGYLWQAYHRLAARRTAGAMSVNPITFAEIEAFTRITGLRLAPWEVELIEKLDDLQRAGIAERMAKRSKPAEPAAP